MFSENRYIILFIFLAGCLAILGIFYFIDTRERMREELIAEVSDFIPMSITPTELSNDEIRVYRYATLHSIDPIFALAGTDTDELRTALTAFEESANAAYIPHKENIDKEVLYPINLLTSLSHTEDIRRSFLETPTQDAAYIYHEALVQLIKEYDSALQKLQDQLATEKSPQIMFWQGPTDSVFILNQLQKIRTQLRIAYKKEDDLYNCLTSNRSCSLLSENRARADATQEPAETPLLQLPPDIFQNRSFIEELSVRSRNTETNSLTGKSLNETPIFILNDTYCAPNDGPHYVYLLTHDSRISNITATRAITLNDLYFNDIHKQQELGYLDPEPLIPDEYPFRLQLNNFYTCVDHGADQQKTLSMQYIRHALDKRPFTVSESVSDDRSAQLLTLQSQITANKVVTDTNVDKFITLLEALYIERGTKEFDMLFGDKSTSYALELIQVWKSKGAWFNTIIGAMDDLMFSKLFAYDDGTAIVRTPIFLIDHSNMTSLYQFANGTVMENYVTLLKDSDKLPPFPENFRGYVLSYKDTVKDWLPANITLIEYVIESEKFFNSIDSR